MSSDTIQTGSGKDRVIWAWFPVTLLTAIFCCVLWGSASPAIKIAYELFKIGPEDTASRIMLAGARFMIAGAMTILFGSLLARKFLLPKKESWKNVLVLSLVQTVGQYFFFFMALANTSGLPYQDCGQPEYQFEGRYAIQRTQRYSDLHQTLLFLSIL